MNERTWTIGSSPDCDIRVDSATVSGRHCRLSQQGQTFVLEDLGSTNGTFVAGQRIDRPRDVRRGEAITLGRSVPMPWPNLSCITVGRLPDNDVVIPLDMVSGHHARLECEGNRVFIVDLQSRNGTSLNHPLNKIGRAVLQPGDAVFLGSYEVAAEDLLAAMPEELPNPNRRIGGRDASPLADTGLNRSPAKPKGPALPVIRVFVSSPGDVAEERVIAARVLKRVAGRFVAVARIEPIFWEHEPLLATNSFQAQIPPPSAAEIFVCILWSRLGTRLPVSTCRKDGSAYQSGTEFEFEDAISAFRKKGMPDLVVYRKTAEPVISLRNREAVREALRQGELLDTFIQHWFHGRDGTLKAAFHPFKDASEFEEQLELHLMKLVGKRVKQAGGETLQARVTWTVGSPYRGLEAFDFEHEPLFFGRTAATSAAIRRLREQGDSNRPFLLILGASGSGKSSLARAGVLPMLTRPGVVPGVADWRRAIMRPSDTNGNLLLGLVTALARPNALPGLIAQDSDLAGLSNLILTDSQRVLVHVAGALRDLAGGAGKVNLVVLIDQLEEVFTLDSVTGIQRQVFFAFIENLVSAGVWVIATLRSDFYHLCAEVPELGRLKAGSGQYDVQPPTPTEIAAIVRQPAVAAGLRFEQSPDRNERLQDLLADDAARCPESLPLLSFTLDELYRRRSDQNALRLSVYHQLGRLEGALAHRAGEVFLALPQEVQASLPRVFRQLVTVGAEDDAKAVRKPAPTAAFDSDPLSARFVRAFIDARLFTTKESADAVPIVEITHEAILTRWQPAQTWLAADREHLRIFARVKLAARIWDESGRSADWLLSGGQPLDEARQLVDAGFQLSPSELALVKASDRRVWRNCQLRRGGVAVLIALTIVSGVGFILAERNRKIAEQSFSEARKTVDEFVTEISREELSVIPGLQDVRQKFALRAVDRYEQFAADRPNDPEVRAGLAEAKISLGQVIAGIGSRNRAIDEMKQSIALMERDVAQDPSAKNRTRLNHARISLVRLYVTMDQNADALPLVESAIDDLTAVVTVDPAILDAQYELGLAFNARASCHRNAREPEKAFEDYQRSRDIFSKLTDVHPRKADCYAGLSAALHNMHFLPKSQKNYRQALELLEASAKYDKLTLELTPLAPQAISNNTIGLCNEAAIFVLMGNRESASKAYSDAEIASRRVVADNPKVSRYQWLLADTLKQRAQHLSSIECFSESQKLYEESCQILEKLVTRADDWPQYATALIEIRLALAEFYRGSRAGKKDEEACRKCLLQAINSGKQLGERFSKATDLNYQFARAYFQLGVLEQDGDRPKAAVNAFRNAIQIYRDKVALAGSSQDPYQQSDFLGWIDSARSSAEEIGRTDDVLQWITIGEDLGSSCTIRAGKQALAGLLNSRGSIHRKAGRNRDAITAYQAALAVARPAWEDAKWHWYLHQAVAGAYLHLAELYQVTGDLQEEVHARQEWLRIWGGPLESFNTEGLIDPDPPPSEAVAKKLRAEMGKDKGIKRFTIPCDFNGVKYPFHVYIMEVRWPKDPLEDQAKWLEEERGGKIPEEVRESFRRLHKIAHENNVSFQDLCVYALGTKSKQEGKTKDEK